MSSSSLLSLVADFLPSSSTLKEGVAIIESDEKSRLALETVLYLCSGASPLEALQSTVSPAEWAQARIRLQAVLDSLAPNVSHMTSGSKRPLEADADAPDQVSKKAKLAAPDDPNDTPIFTLHNMSLTSPIRKKADITVYRSSLRFTDPKDPSTKTNLCDPIPIRQLRNAFLVSTPGKSKPHWTVIILSEPSGDPTSSATQVIFGCDATLTAPQSTTKHPAAAQVHAKGAPSKTLLHTLFAYFPSGPDGLVDLYEPKAADFQGTLGHGQSIDAYIGAKDGHLHFFGHGILWGEKKPCIWFPTSEIVDMHTGLSTGRAFTLYISTRRRLSGESVDDDDDDIEMHDFSLIDSKEEEPVKGWIAKHKKDFARAAASADPNAMQIETQPGASKSAIKDIAKAASALHSSGPVRLMDAVLDENDEDDQDFAASDSDSSGSGGSSSSDESGDEGEGSGGGSADENDGETRGTDGRLDTAEAPRNEREDDEDDQTDDLK